MWLPLLVLVGVAGRGPNEAVLVGAKGEVVRLVEGAWRPGEGGVAATLIQAGGGEVTWAMGAATPPYRHDGKTWSAAPVPRSGVALLAPGPAPAVLIGRRVLYKKQPGSGRDAWSELPLLPAPAVAVTRAPDLIVATAKGDLVRWTGSAWRTVRGARVGASGLFTAGRAIVATAADGSLLLIEGGSARKLASDEKLGAFRPLASAGGLLAGDGGGRLVLAALRGGKLVFVDETPGLAPGEEPAGMLVGEKGEKGDVLIAGKSGTVLRRAAGGAWTTEHVEGGEPAAGHVANPPATAGR